MVGVTPPSDTLSSDNSRTAITYGSYVQENEPRAHLNPLGRFRFRRTRFEGKESGYGESGACGLGLGDKKGSYEKEEWGRGWRYEEVNSVLYPP